MKLYVGNLSYSTTEDTLREAFSNYGDVVSVTIMKDRFTEQSKGFGFVEMATDIMGERGIGGMNGKTIDGRRLRVSEAVEKKQSNNGAKQFFKERDFSRQTEGRASKGFRGERNRFGERRERDFGRGRSSATPVSEEY